MKYDIKNNDTSNEQQNLEENKDYTGIENQAKISTNF